LAKREEKKNSAKSENKTQNVITIDQFARTVFNHLCIHKEFYFFLGGLIIGYILGLR
jgi:hypothetical protein